MIEGGVGIEKNLNVGENFTALGNATIGDDASDTHTFNGTVNFTHLVNLNGGIDVDNIDIGGADPNLITTDTGDLKLSADGSSTVQVDDDLGVNGVLTANQLNVDETRLNGNILETTSGNNDLTLQAHGTGVVDINDTLKLNGLNFDGDSETYTSVDTDLSSVSSNHDTLASAKSIEAAITAIDTTLAVSADSGTNQDIDLKTEILDIEGTTNEIETSTGTNKVVIGLPNNVTVGNNLTVTNNLGADQVNVNDLRLDSNIISTTATNSNINLRPNGTGSVVVGTNADNKNVTIHGNLTVNGTNNNFEHLEVDNVEIQDNTITTTDTNGDLQLNANGSGNVRIRADQLDVDNDLDVQGTTDLDTTNIVGTLTVNGIIDIDNLRLDTNTLGSTSGGITINPTGNQDVFVGDIGSTTELICRGDIRAFDTSDRTLKENITPIPNALDKILSLSGNTFTWNKETKHGGEEDIGVIAQEVEALGLPNITTTRTDGTKAVMYKKLIPVLIEAIKELKSEIEELKK